MYCYYQGEMEVTEGTGFCLLRDAVEVVKNTFENHGVCAYKDFNDPEIIIVDFSDSCYVSEEEIRVFRRRLDVAATRLERCLSGS